MCFFCQIVLPLMHRKKLQVCAGKLAFSRTLFYGRKKLRTRFGDNSQLPSAIPVGAAAKLAMGQTLKVLQWTPPPPSCLRSCQVGDGADPAGPSVDPYPPRLCVAAKLAMGQNRKILQETLSLPSCPQYTQVGDGTDPEGSAVDAAAPPVFAIAKLAIGRTLGIFQWAPPPILIVL